MQEQVRAYFDKALACDTLVMASLFQPGLRLHFFDGAFGEFDSCTIHACSLLTSVFHERMAIFNQSAPHVTNKASSALKNRMGSTKTQEAQSGAFAFGAVIEGEKVDKLDAYLNSVDYADPTKMQDPLRVLIWWKVSAKSLSNFNFIIQIPDD